MSFIILYKFKLNINDEFYLRLLFMLDKSLILFLSCRSKFFSIFLIMRFTVVLAGAIFF